MEIKKQKDKLKLTWKTKVQTLKFIKNDKEYYSYNTSFPVDLKKYIEDETGATLEKLTFYNYMDRIVIASGVAPEVVENSTTAKLIHGVKNQLVYTLPKKIFEGLSPNCDRTVSYELEYVEDIGDYLVFCDF